MIKSGAWRPTVPPFIIGQTLNGYVHRRDFAGADIYVVGRAGDCRKRLGVSRPRKRRIYHARCRRRGVELERVFKCHTFAVKRLVYGLGIYAIFFIVVKGRRYKILRPCWQTQSGAEIIRVGLPAETRPVITVASAQENPYLADFGVDQRIILGLPRDGYGFCVHAACVGGIIHRRRRRLVVKQEIRDGQNRLGIPRIIFGPRLYAIRRARRPLRRSIYPMCRAARQSPAYYLLALCDVIDIHPHRFYSAGRVGSRAGNGRKGREG